MKMKKRGGFVLSFCLLICLCLSTNDSVVQANIDTGEIDFKVNVVHTNDIHARIKEDSDNQVIGLPKVKAYRDQESQKSDLSLMLDAGDTFHGQASATLARGESVAELLGVCGYDAMVVGNHDWNYKKDQLKKLEGIVREKGNSEFSILAGNVLKENGDSFFDQKYLIKQVEKQGETLKVGVFGVIDPAIYNAIAPQNVEGLSFIDMEEYAKKMAEELKNQGCQIVIGMAYCKDPEDLASSVNGVNLWIAGYGHDKINKMVSSPNHSQVLVVATGDCLSSFGNVEIYCTLRPGQSPKIIMQEYRKDYEDVAVLKADEQAENAIKEIDMRQLNPLNEPAGNTPERLNGEWKDLRIGETTMGRAVTDAYLLHTGADIAFESAGWICASIPEGAVIYKNVLDVCPYENHIVAKELTGKEILEILETSLEIMKANQAASEEGASGVWPANSGSMLQVGGMEIQYNMSFDKGNRIVRALVKGEAIQEDKTYKVAMNEYLPNDKENYPQLTQKTNVYESRAICRDVLKNYFEDTDSSVISEGLSQERLIKTTKKHDQKALSIHGAEEPFVYGDEGVTLRVSGGSTQKKVYFTSSDTRVAMVDSVGKLSINGVGEAEITVTMEGNGEYEDVSAKIMVRVQQAETDVTLTYTEVEKPVLTAEAKKVGNGEYPTGRFLFVIDEHTQIEVKADANGQALADLSNFTKGKHTALVIYQGDKNYKKSSEPTVIEFEIPKSDQKALSIHGAEEPFVYGDEGVTLRVSGGSTQRKVYFTSSDTRVAMVDSVGKLSINGAGEAEITVTMEGNEEYEDVSAKIMVRVEQAETDVTLTYTEVEKPVLTAEAKKAGNGTYPTGKFLFVIDEHTQIEVEIDANGQALADLSNLTKGKHTASVIYQGDENYKRSSEPTVIEFEISKSEQETIDIEKPEDSEKPEESVKTGDETNVEFYILLALVGIIGAAAGIKRKQGSRQG